MWIVRLALRRPYTFVVMSVLMLVLGVSAILTMPTDIFPYINIPVVSIVWTYTGLSPDEMEKRMVTICERAMTTTVNDIEHMESTSYQGVAVIRVFFQPKAKVELAISQVTAIVQTILRVLPPGTLPPAVLKYDASSVPILQLAEESDTLSEQQLFDLGLNFIRTQLATVQGAAVPLPYGGKQRQIMVDIDSSLLYAKRLSASDVDNALNLQNVILPGGDAKIGDRDYFVQINGSPGVVEELNDLPIKTVNGSTVYMRDIGQVRDGYAVQANIVRVNGKRAALLTVLKSGQASTLNIVASVKKALIRIQAGMPPALNIVQLFDQSLFVRAAITGVLREGAIAAGLTGIMILLFLGSWRSTLIVCISIPLSILTSIIILAALGETINVMTLGGLALAVGILVDDATVEIENIHRNLGMKKPIVPAILDGAQQIAVPAFVSTLAICIVFVPVLLLTGAAKFLFTPLAMAVVFAMLTSYLLTRTLVPTMVHFLLPPEVELYQQGEEGKPAHAPGIVWRVHHAFDERFEGFRNRYSGWLSYALDHRGLVAIIFGIFVIASLPLAFVVGRDFFPYVDSGQMRLHVNAPEGTRIEETEQIFAAIEGEIRKEIPLDEIQTIVDNIGLPASGINLAFGDSSTIGGADGEILIALHPDRHGPSQEYERKLRARLNQKFPNCTFFFQAANITNQILNFGLPAPIDVQVIGRNSQGNYKIARDIAAQVAAVPGAVDVHIKQQVAYPSIMINVDRTKADQAGLTQRDVANSVLISLSSSGQLAPNQWLNPANGVNYQVAVQMPQYRVDSFDSMKRIPITGGNATAASAQLLSNLATFKRGTTTTIVDHYNVQPTYDVFASTDLRDLGGVASQVYKIVDTFKGKVAKGNFINVRGQVDTMNSSFFRLGLGMFFAIMLVYLLMVVNFQSWVDPFIILMAIPGTLAGILWMLFITQTTLNVPSLMGAIMSVGVATANSILLVTFANDERVSGKNGIEAAHSAGFTRIRPVIMTATAMMIGMLPMSLALGEGGEQNAPLGRAVIGGLLIATFSTLFFVPIMYTFLRKDAPVDWEARIEREAHEVLPEKPRHAPEAEPQNA
ncbi:efflux RND transporter permease subunit [Nevskia soli]|uniref:efflux RND transporter permease subunit n=1 Tax=Nevskia soli TaxID=418856 RepID=UPI0015D95E71|nr:efflux RND transporter permease subunit [Nevskia soli]